MLSIYKIYIYNFYDILSLTCGYTHVNDIYVHVYKHIYIYINMKRLSSRGTHTQYQTGIPDIFKDMCMLHATR